MMKYIVAIAAALFWYPVFAFVSLELNPANWSQFARVMLCYFSICSGGMAFYLMSNRDIW